MLPRTAAHCVLSLGRGLSGKKSLIKWYMFFVPQAQASDSLVHIPESCDIAGSRCIWCLLPFIPSMSCFWSACVFPGVLGSVNQTKPGTSVTPGATVSLASSWTLSFWAHPLSGGGAVLISSECFLFMLDFENPSQTFVVQWWKDLRANQKHRLSHRLLNGSLNFHPIPWGNCLHVAMWLYHGLVRYKSA